MTKQADQNRAESFSIMDAIGGRLGIVESVTPTLVFMIAFIIMRSVTVPVICSLALSLIFCVIRLVRREKIRSAVMGLLLAVVCAVAALATGQARNYYVPGFIVNGVWLVILLLSIIGKTPGLGLVVQAFNQPFEGGFAKWREKWTKNPQLYRAYRDATWMWVGMFALRLVVEIPLWALKLSTALGVARIVTGIPLFALVMWLTWVVVAPAVRQSRQQSSSEEPDEKSGEKPDGKLESSVNADNPETRNSVTENSVTENGENK